MTDKVLAGLQKWLPILVTIVGFGIFLGATDSRLTRHEDALLLKADTRDVRDLSNELDDIKYLICLSHPTDSRCRR